MSAMDGFDASARAARGAFGPCRTEGCDGTPRRVSVAHGANVMECTECGIRYAQSAGGS